MRSSKNKTATVVPLRQAHPWHGVPVGTDAPRVCNAFIELVPSDVVKYEIDKPSGLLRIDRPQRFSSQCPMPYGFIPQTYCDSRVAALGTPRPSKRVQLKGDGDPLDICVLSERIINHGNVLVTARPIGGLRMVDRGEADDKIIAVIAGDAVYDSWQDLDDCPIAFVERLKHYFLSYKSIPGTEGPRVEIRSTYGVRQAYKVIDAAMEDYREMFGNSGATQV